MNVTMTKRTIKGLPPKKSVLIESKHGMGKSQIIAQTAAELSKETGVEYGFIDIRLAQREVGDMIGMMHSVETFDVIRKVFKDGKITEQKEVAHNITVHDLPLWFPTDPNSRGLLFLDELNRATRDVQQAAFELVLDYRMNLHDLPLGWRVVAATNDNQDAYSVLGLDPALYDRFLVIKFAPTEDEWLAWAKQNKLHDAVIKYVDKHRSQLDPPDVPESNKIYPSRRSWESLSDAIKYMTANGDKVLKDHEYLTLLSVGYVGQTTALSFTEFVKKDYKVYMPKEILADFGQFRKDFEAMEVPDLSYYSREIANYIAEEKLRLTKKQQANLSDYFLTIPKEAAAGFFSELSEKAHAELTRWYKGDERVRKLTMDSLFKEKAMA